MSIDAQSHVVIAAEVSLVQVADNEVMPTLIKPLRRKIKQVSADGAYDTRDGHALLKQQGIKMTIPPRKNAVLWEEGHPRNEAVMTRQPEISRAGKKKISIINVQSGNSHIPI